MCVCVENVLRCVCWYKACVVCDYMQANGETEREAVTIPMQYVSTCLSSIREDGCGEMVLFKPCPLSCGSK